MFFLPLLVEYFFILFLALHNYYNQVLKFNRLMIPSSSTGVWRNQAFLVRRALVRLGPTQWSPDLSREVHHFQRGRKLQEDGAPWLVLTTTWRHQPARPVGSSVFTQMWNQLCCNLQHFCSVLELSAASQPLWAKAAVLDAERKNIVHSYQACFFFLKRRAFMSSQALFSWWLGLSRYQIWNKIVYSTFCHAAWHSSSSFALH